MYPSETGAHGELLEEAVASAPQGQLAIAMRSVAFVDFYHKAWPELRRRRQPFVVVTAMEDNSAPWEMFNCLAGLGSQDHPNGTDMRHFIRHRLMRHWFTQNYDLLPSAGKRIHFDTGDRREGACANGIGLDPGKDSDVDPASEAALVDKVSPLPIGNNIRCDLLTTWREVVASAPLLSERRLVIPITFTAAGRNSHFGQRDRRKTALKELAQGSRTQMLPRMPIEKLWRALTAFAFVAAPASRGQDTFRFWESIALGAIPIVQAGPLDGLYAQLPCVIVSRWSGLSEPALAEWRRTILERFGSDPRAHPRVRRLMNETHLAELIRKARRIPMWLRPRSDVAHLPRGVVNHTCDMARGGILTSDRRDALGC